MKYQRSIPARLTRLIIAASVWHSTSAFSTPAASASTYATIQTSSSLLDPITGEERSSPILPPSAASSSSDSNTKKKTLVVLLPQLGEFDSSEYCEFLLAAEASLEDSDIDLQVVGIGDTTAARNFCDFTGLSPSKLSIDPNGDLHRALNLHAGPEFDVPEGVSNDVLKFFLRQLPGGIPSDEEMVRPVSVAWLNYLAMCAGIGAPGTLPEILRGYFGDKNAPERFRDDDVVKAGFITIGPGVGPTSIGPLKYQQWFADEKGYQRPVELATIRLKNMVEVLTKWDNYVSNPLAIALRGATYLFDEEGKELYSYKSRGVLTYSETMPRPLTFLSPYIGENVARNPLGLPDNGGGDLVRGRGVLKPAGKAMKFLSFLFKLENKLQAQLLGAEDADYAAAKKEIEDTISKNKIVIYTYGLSPFSTETRAVLDEIGADYEDVEVGLEWFLLGKEKSTLRAELLEMTGQSSLPHVFINGEHVGGLFTGSSDGKYPGLAGLKESGELQKMLGDAPTAISSGDPELLSAAGAVE
mmetsp:Transcript_27580/g.58283  ORF Transcript_27580/g.58283 Transcript_27580/m.58283 type:complete len:527 (+) Transcript_27580:172-1752(+)|eukprot:CAMPEP_0183738976 /NCGR_PEP_ID=MMETSP0737-20130205/55909_1 /TAXON_ID=385413 /ORGANISM="Thalassiosira miniscula, Strain CCMP1093" /LENGTH=526 /DNA_ID=CAMNT_0025973637 /DNA_START=114 /DNA_END=1694 /DNA_ORIENTATION=+